MIAFIRNMKLRQKMTLGFSVALFMLLASLAFGLFGLLTNSHQISDFKGISDEQTMANQIQAELLNSRIAFKQFQTTGDESQLFAFEESYGNMQTHSEAYSMLSSDPERLDLIKQIDFELKTYSQGFQQLRNIDNQMSAYYTSTAAAGYDVLDALERLSEKAHLQDDDDMHYMAAHALQCMLKARLHAQKYFTFHGETEYQAYLEDIASFEEKLRKMERFKGDLQYEGDYNLVVRSAKDYQDSMAYLHDRIVEQDILIAGMDSIGPKVTEITELIVASALEDQKAYENEVIQRNRMMITLMSVIAIIAIVVALIVSKRLVEIVTEPINYLTKAFKEISEGDVDLDFRLMDQYNDEIGLMSKSFNKFMIRLKALMEEVQTQNWFKTAQNDLNELLRDQQDIVDMSNAILTYLCTYLEAPIGAIYTSGENQSLHLTATYAFTNRKGMMQHVQLGEGLVGQSALEKKPFVIEELPDDYLAIQSGLGEAPPTSVMVLPCVYEGEVKAVIELGSLRVFDENEMELMKSLADVIAITMYSTEVRNRMKELLDKTLHQSEELQMQQEELRQSNEELEEQTRALRESESRLQAQQEELRVSNEELEERTHQLELQKQDLDRKNKAILASQQEIVRKAEELEMANSYKSEFLANMSHELRTPLNSILVLSQLLSGRDNDKPLSHKELEFAKTIHSSGSDLLTLINDILDLSKVEAGKLDIHDDQVNLQDLLDANTALFQSVAESGGISFHTELGTDLPEEIVTDSVRLQQIIKNLVSNALKFTHEGHVRLTARKTSALENDALGLSEDTHIAITVDDTGIGIPHEKQRVIFEAFRQSDGTTSRKYGGTGLGLTISRELAKLLGAQIMVESAEGQGSTFAIILPKHPERRMDMEAKSAERLPDEPVRLPQESMLSTSDVQQQTDGQDKATDLLVESVESDNNLLLIIEDDENFAHILAGMAEERGYDVMLAHTGKDGEALAISNQPAAILLDLGLPDADGMDLAAKLGRRAETKDIPIHIISGRETDGMASLPSSVIGFLKKPVDIRMIYKTLAAIEKSVKADFKKLLVVGPCSGESFDQFTKLADVEVHHVMTGQEGLEKLAADTYQCVVLDIELTGDEESDLLSSIHEKHGDMVPMIIYSEKEIGAEQLEQISRYTDNIILKSPKSQERMLDEVTLFLHGMEEQKSLHTSATGESSHRVKGLIKERVEQYGQVKGKRILLVDDDDRNVFALQSVLEQHGLDVQIAKDGKEAIEAFKRAKDIDLILMDIMMPKMDGYEATGAIRALDSGKDVPIIALTAKAMKEDREKCLQAGANDYLTKPIDIERMMSLLKVWLA